MQKEAPNPAPVVVSIFDTASNRPLAEDKQRLLSLDTTRRLLVASKQPDSAAWQQLDLAEVEGPYSVMEQSQLCTEVRHPAHCWRIVFASDAVRRAWTLALRSVVNSARKQARMQQVAAAAAAATTTTASEKQEPPPTATPTVRTASPAKTSALSTRTPAPGSGSSAFPPVSSDSEDGDNLPTLHIPLGSRIRDSPAATTAASSSSTPCLPSAASVDDLAGRAFAGRKKSSLSPSPPVSSSPPSSGEESSRRPLSHKKSSSSSAAAADESSSRHASHKKSSSSSSSPVSSGEESSRRRSSKKSSSRRKGSCSPNAMRRLLSFSPSRRRGEPPSDIPSESMIRMRRHSAVHVTIDPQRAPTLYVSFCQTAGSLLCTNNSSATTAAAGGSGSSAAASSSPPPSSPPPSQLSGSAPSSKSTGISPSQSSTGISAASLPPQPWSRRRSSLGNSYIVSHAKTAIPAPTPLFAADAPAPGLQRVVRSPPLQVEDAPLPPVECERVGRSPLLESSVGIDAADHQPAPAHKKDKKNRITLLKRRRRSHSLNTAEFFSGSMPIDDADSTPSRSSALSTRKVLSPEPGRERSPLSNSRRPSISPPPLHPQLSSSPPSTAQCRLRHQSSQHADLSLLTHNGSPTASPLFLDSPLSTPSPPASPRHPSSPRPSSSLSSSPAPATAKLMTASSSLPVPSPSIAAAVSIMSAPPTPPAGAAPSTPGSMATSVSAGSALYSRTSTSPSPPAAASRSSRATSPEAKSGRPFFSFRRKNAAPPAQEQEPEPHVLFLGTLEQSRETLLTLILNHPHEGNEEGLARLLALLDQVHAHMEIENQQPRKAGSDRRRSRGSRIQPSSTAAAAANRRNASRRSTSAAPVDGQSAADDDSDSDRSGSSSSASSSSSSSSSARATTSSAVAVFNSETSLSESPSLSLPSGSDDTEFDFYRGGDEPLPSSCPICYEPVKGRGHVRLACSHSYCLHCILNYFYATICDGMTRLLCPDPSCKVELSEQTVLALLEDVPSLADRYRRFRRIDQYRGNPNCRWCFRCAEPNLCTPAQQQRADRLDCVSCQAAMCSRCAQAFHPGEPCPDIALESDLIRWSGGSNPQVLAKPCPRCRCWIEKSKGCNEMRCANCGYFFCWICLQPSGPGHYDRGPCKGLDGHTASDNVVYYSALGVMLLSAPIWLPMYGVYKLTKKVVSKKAGSTVAATSGGDGQARQPRQQQEQLDRTPNRPRSDPNVSLAPLKSRSDSNLVALDMDGPPAAATQASRARAKERKHQDGKKSTSKKGKSKRPKQSKRRHTTTKAASLS